MLKQRLITALILIPIVFAGLIFLPKLALAIAFGIVCLIGCWEWSRIVGVSHPAGQAVYLLASAGAMLLLYQLPVLYVFAFALALWCLLGLWVSIYPKGTALWQRFLSLRLILGLCVILPAWQALLFTRYHDNGLLLLFLMLIVIWSMDSGAYFAGRAFGKHSLAPLISPKKTREGTYGGIILTAIVAIAYGYFLLPPLYFSFTFGLVLLTTALMAVLGDLIESLVKRQGNVKDSGTILPGHGGILDRLDSLFAAAPIFAFGVWLA